MSDYYEPNVILGNPAVASIHDMLYHGGTIFVTGQITRDLALSVIKQIRVACAIAVKRHAQKQSDEKPVIDINIDSEGGDLTSAYMIYDEIRRWADECEMYTLCMGHAYSAGALILSAGTHRFIYKHAKVFLHLPGITASDVRYDAGSIVDVADKLTAERNDICRLISEATGKDPSEVLGKMVRETTFTAEEAVQFGLADEIV